MPFFFIAPIWILVVVAGIGIFFSKRLRFLSSYLLLCSTLGLIVSFMLSLGLLMLTGKLLAEHLSYGWLALVAYFVGIPIGGIAGALLGFFLARALNRRLGWQ